MAHKRDTILQDTVGVGESIPFTIVVAPTDVGSDINPDEWTKYIEYYRIRAVGRCLSLPLF